MNLDLTTSSLTGSIDNIDIIDLAADSQTNTLKLAANDPIDIPDDATSLPLRILKNGSDTVDLSEITGLTKQGSQVNIDGVDYFIYQDDDASHIIYINEDSNIII